MQTTEVITNRVLESMEAKSFNKSQFARENGISHSGLRWRMNNGWPVEKWGEPTRRPIDYDSYVGRKFGSVVIESIHQEGVTHSGNKRMRVSCRCEKCGHQFTSLLSSMERYQSTERCPECRRKGMILPYHKERVARHGMIFRCYNPKAQQFHNYGGRGITVCERWLESFDNFLADMGPCPKGYSLDRIDVNGNYEPSNCRWASQKTQGNNTRTNHRFEYHGLNLTSAEWGHLLNVQPQRLRAFAKRHNDDISLLIDKLGEEDPSIFSWIMIYQDNNDS